MYQLISYSNLQSHSGFMLTGLISALSGYVMVPITQKGLFVNNYDNLRVHQILGYVAIVFLIFLCCGNWLHIYKISLSKFVSGVHVVVGVLCYLIGRKLDLSFFVLIGSLDKFKLYAFPLHKISWKYRVCQAHGRQARPTFPPSSCWNLAHHSHTPLRLHVGLHCVEWLSLGCWWRLEGSDLLSSPNRQRWRGPGKLIVEFECYNHDEYKS